MRNNSSLFILILIAFIVPFLFFYKHNVAMLVGFGSMCAVMIIVTYSVYSFSFARSINAKKKIFVNIIIFIMSYEITFGILSIMNIFMLKNSTNYGNLSSMSVVVSCCPLILLMSTISMKTRQ